MNILRWLRREWDAFCEWLKHWGAFEICEGRDGCDGYGLRRGPGGNYVLCGKCGGDGTVRSPKP